MIFLEINEWSDMDELEFAIEKFGRDPEESETRRYYFGRLDKDPDAANTPEELAELDRIYNEVDRQSLPKSYDARAKGTLLRSFKSLWKLNLWFDYVHISHCHSRICHQC